MKRMELSENARTILESRYLLKGRNGEIKEDPEELMERVARSIASVEKAHGGDPKKREKEFLELLQGRYFLPNSPTLMNAGLEGGQLSACYVLPIEDSIDSVFETLKRTAIIQQSGGGTGFNFSALRPKSSPVGSSGGPASGPISFMKLFSRATETIKQGGERRGANMGILDIEHPDIVDFIQVKDSEDTLSNFNISIGITDRFMEALDEGEDWRLEHPRGGKGWSMPARELWDALIENAWASGDPGLIFLDRIEEENPVPRLGPIRATNPCGEVPLQPYESCNLGSIDLARFVTQEGELAEEALERTVRTAIRFLDNVIDANHYSDPKTREMALGNRKVGLGVMGWAEFLIRSGIPYASKKALETGDHIMGRIAELSKESSMELAEERGSFPNWSSSRYDPDTPIRNATRTSIAPTGTISSIADSTPSIEPLYALAYRRKHVLDEQVLTELDPAVLDHLKKIGADRPGILEHLKRNGSVQDLKEIPEDSRELLRTALEIPYNTHIDHQTIFQKHTDNAVSKTINLPEDADRKDVDAAYRKAWKDGAKGITIYRDRSKQEQVLEQGTTESRKASCEVCSL